jgi:hypothetical protein
MKRFANDPTRGMELVCGAVAALILLWFFIGLMGCKTTKTATRTVTDTVRVVRIDSVAVSKDTETGNKQDEYTRIIERFLPGTVERDTITLTEYIRTPPRLIERIIEKGSSQMQWQKINYDSIARAVADSLAATKTEAVKVVEKTRFPFWIVFALLGGLGIYIFAAYRKTK